MKSQFIAFFCFIFSVYGYCQDAEWYLIREDTEIFVREAGSGKDTVLVIHGGFGANHDYMTDAVKGLEDRFHFVFFDQRGSLLSPAKKENLTFRKNVDDIKALVEALEVKTVKILAHSMGTLVAMEYCQQWPETVSHLVLTGAILPKSDSLETVFSNRQNEQIRFLMNRESVAALRKPFVEKGADSLTTPAEIKNSELTHRDLTTYWRINFASVNLFHAEKYNLLKGGRAYYNPDAAVMGETVNWKYDYRSVLNDKVKTTIINGAYDFIDFDSEETQNLIRNYPEIRLRIIPEAGHNSWIDDPLSFRDFLLEALQR